MFYKIAQLMLAPKRNAATSDIFIAQTDSLKESLAGKLFVLAEIESKKPESLKIINFIIDNIYVNYYQNEKIILREKISTLKVEHIFESALAKTNANFAEFLRNEKIKINPSSINITIGVVHEDKLYFSNSGKNKVFLIYQQKTSRQTGANEKKYKIIDIAEKTFNNNDSPSTQKLFANAINGQIPPKGYFLVTSEALPEYISNKQLINIITTLPPASAVEQIKNILTKINVYVSFLAIVVKTTSASEISEEIKPRPRSTQDSVADLNRTEERTENLLSPSGIINAKKFSKYLRFNIFAPKKKKVSSRQKTLNLKDNILFKKSSADFSSKFIKYFKNIFIYTANFIFFTAKTLSSRRRLGLSINNLSNILKNQKNKFLSFCLKLNKKSKIVLALGFIFIILFAINLFFIQNKNKQINEENNYKKLTALIEQKENQADANLLYSNEEGALELFNEIEGLLKQYPQKTEEQIKKLSKFKEKLNSQLEKIRNVVRIDDALELADFTKLNSSAKPNNIFLSADNKKIIAADSNDKSIYSLNLSDNLATTLADLAQKISSLRFPSAGPRNSIYYFNNKNIIALNTDDMSLSNLTITLLSDPKNFTAADTYNNRLYLLEAKDSNIYRYNRSGQSFSSAYAWLSAGINLNGAVDISIDGNIYVLKNNGEVLKLLRGEQQEFNLEKSDPPLEHPTKIFVSPELDYIYILEPSNKRLLIFDKKGQFLMQYTSAKFTNLIDFVVDESAKTIYFLNNTSVYKIKAQHFSE